MRHDYRNAIVQGRRSVSGKFVHLLKELWGGSPAIKYIQHACYSLDYSHLLEKYLKVVKTRLKESTMLKMRKFLIMELTTLKVCEKQVNDTNASISTSNDFFQKPEATTATFVDNNKRKMFEKN